jgi:hypothetical protein
MTTRSLLERQTMRCGREAPVPEADLVVDKDGVARSFMAGGVRRRFMTAPKLDALTCPGYASELPEVDEIVYAYPQWKERTLTEWLGEPPTRQLLTGLACLEAGKNQCESDRMERQRREREAKNG